MTAATAGPDARRPALVERVPAWVDGRPSTRLIFIFRAVGCAWARRPDGGCTNCGFQGLTSGGVPVSGADLIAQFDSVFGDDAALAGVGEVDLYNSGSFFADAEVPAAVRAHACRRLGRAPVRRVLVESRPEHLRVDEIAPLVALLGARELEVGIGLESADDRVREVLVNKGFGRADFERAAGVLAAAGARLLAYVLVKPLGLDEAEAVADAVSTARWVFETARRAGVPARVALQPVFVAPGTRLEREFLAGRYAPPSLWSVVDVVRQAHPAGELLVGLSDEGLSPRQAPAGCPRCTGALRAALAGYNRSRDLSCLDAVECPGCAGRVG